MVSEWTDGELRTADDATLHYYRRGKGPSLVLAHGSSDNGRCWTRVASALEESFDIIAYDARSHGRSDTASDGGPAPAADLITVIETLGLAPTLAMGHSMGAATVSAAIAERPDLFRAAVLEDPGWMTEARLAEVMALARRAMEAPAGSPERSGGRPAHPEDLIYWEESKRQYRPPEMARGIGRLLGAPWQQDVRRFRCPVLLLWGTSGLVTAETAEEAHQLDPTLRDVQLDTGHGVRYEAMEPYTAAVLEFLCSAAPPTAPQA